MRDLERLLFGDDGKLRPFWRAAIYFGLTFWVLPRVVFPLAVPLATWLQLSPGLTAGVVAFFEAEYFVIALIPTTFFAWYEGRRIDSYGLMLGRAFGVPTWEGVVAGALCVGAVGIAMLALGGMQVRGLAAPPDVLVLSAVAWIGANICVGIAEEFWFRHYFLATLWKSIGFWPASGVVAIVFAALHYFNKPGENIWDMITLVSFSMLMCYSVLRTGALWFAVGFHGAFDFMQLVVVGTANGGQVPAGRLFDATFHGPQWLTGGSLGTEASVIMYPVFALVWLYLQWRYPRSQPDAPTGSSLNTAPAF